MGTIAVERPHVAGGRGKNPCVAGGAAVGRCVAGGAAVGRCVAGVAEGEFFSIFFQLSLEKVEENINLYARSTRSPVQIDRKIVLKAWLSWNERNFSEIEENHI